jgi:hypothetical protein
VYSRRQPARRNIGQERFLFKQKPGNNVQKSLRQVITAGLMALMVASIGKLLAGRCSVNAGVGEGTSHEAAYPGMAAGRFLR